MRLAPSGRLVRFVALVTLVELAAMIGGARWMIHPIRSDGGTWTEYLFFGVYAVVLLLGVGSIMLLLGALARRLLGPKAEELLAIALGALTALALFADEVTFAFLGLHPYGAATWTAVSSADVRQHVPAWAVAAVVAILAAGLILSAGLWVIAGRFGPGSPRWMRLEAGLPLRMPAYFAVGLATFLALDSPDEERVVPRAALPFYGVWIARVNSYPDARPAYAIGTEPAPPPFTRRPDIVEVLVESLRWDTMSPDVMPSLSRLAQRPGCTSAPRHYAGGHLTQYGTFSLLYGLGSYAFLPFMKEGRPSEPLAALRSSGYRLEGYDATGLLYYTIAPVVPSQMNRYESLLGRDSLVIQRMIESLSGRSSAPRFVFGFLYSTHGPYFYPPSFARFPTSGPDVDTRTGVVNRYHNAAGYVDALLARLVSVLAPRLADGSTVLVITGDHGDEFWEHGLLGHAAVQFHDERTRVPLVICFPAVRKLDLTLSTHADIFPTLFDWMGAGGWDTTRLTGRSLLQPSPEKTVILAGAGFPTQAGAFALVTASHKFWLHLNGPDLRSAILDRVTDASDQPVPLTAAVREDFDRALSTYLRQQHALLRVN
jgi:hypothetical protein